MPGRTTQTPAQHPAQGWLAERLTRTAEIAAEMVVLGATAEVAKVAAHVYLTFPTDPHHGVDAIEDGFTRADAIIAIRNWLAAQDQKAAA